MDGGLLKDGAQHLPPVPGTNWGTEYAAETDEGASE